MAKQDYMFKPYKDLEYGDVVKIKAPFEENTREYYNGHSPLDVRGSLVRDKFGNSSKTRPVMVLDVTDDKLFYIPLTTSSRKYARHDEQHQYKLKNNDMTPKHPRREVDTYAETGSVRVFYLNKKWSDVRYFGRIDQVDLKQITWRLNHDARNIVDGVDRHTYMSANKDRFEEALLSAGYQKTQTQTANRYSLENRTFTVYNSGIVGAHFELPLDVVRRRMELLEGQFTPDPHKREIENVTFQTAVASLTDTSPTL